MNDAQQNPKTDSQPFWMRQAPITIIGVFLLGIVGSTVYDLLVKPGITSVGRFILDIVTLGSSTLRDATYSSAALDPRPISALVLLQAGLVVAAFPAVRLIARARHARDLETLEKNIERAEGEGQKEALAREQERLMRKVRKIKIAFWAIFVPWWAALFVAFEVHNQSVVVWRAFNANLAILTPAISVEQKALLSAQFAAMESGNDYQVLVIRMNEFAKVANVKLRDIATW